MFKVGDWVTTPVHLGTEQVKNHNIKWFNSPDRDGDYILWHPKEGEYCWLNKELVKITYINEYDTDEFYFISVVNEDERKGYFSISKFEPFIGTLPSFLKD